MCNLFSKKKKPSSLNIFGLFSKKKKPEKKPGKKYWIAAIFFALLTPAVLLSKLNSRKKKL
jgi:hypothetical protein